MSRDSAPVCISCGRLELSGDTLTDCEGTLSRLPQELDGYCKQCWPDHLAECIDCYKHHVGRSKKDAQNADKIHAQMYTNGLRVGDVLALGFQGVDEHGITYEATKVDPDQEAQK